MFSNPKVNRASPLFTRRLVESTQSRRLHELYCLHKQKTPDSCPVTQHHQTASVVLCVLPEVLTVLQ